MDRNDRSDRIDLATAGGAGGSTDARTNLASWLRQARCARKLSIDDVSRITKIQVRILEKLESGRFEGLPAEVFVRGFVRSFARCVGLDEAEALERYGACAEGEAPPVAKALVDSMAELAPSTAMAMIVDAVPVTLPDSSVVVSAPIETSGEVAVAAAVDTSAPVEIASGAVDTSAPVEVSEPVGGGKKRRSRKRAMADGSIPPKSRKKKQPGAEQTVGASASPTCDTTTVPSSGVEWTPTMPAAPAAPVPPWRKPLAAAPVVPASPTLVIDDADPDQAERLQDARSQKDQRVSFLPPILLDREDRSARQGGLTLAVIILLIAATLTLSYLMRRPSATSAGVTSTETSAKLLG
jgi:cytoskeletal protein RodZ